MKHVCDRIIQCCIEVIRFIIHLSHIQTYTMLFQLKTQLILHVTHVEEETNPTQNQIYVSIRTSYLPCIHDYNQRLL